jgi:esterase/lipase
MTGIALIIFLCLPTGLNADPFDTIRLLPAEAVVYQTDTLFNGDNAETPRFFKTTHETVKGIAVVVHGLNVKPSKMGTAESNGTLVKLLLDSGYHVVRVTLSGHGASLAEMKTVSASQWLSDAYIQYSKAYVEAQDAALPLYLVGFSLGALVFESLMNEATKTPVRFEKAVLFSPAIAIKDLARATLALNPLLKQSAIINSRSPAGYRAQKGASLAAYNALFELEEKLCDDKFANSNIETVLFIDPDDEFISLRKLRKRIKEAALSQWELVAITNDGAKINPPYHHLIIDRNCTGETTWRSIQSKILALLNKGEAN